MNRDMSIAERKAAGVYGAERGCCGTCRTRGPFVHVKSRDLREGDTLKSMVPVHGLNRCALGRVVEVRREDRRRSPVVTVKWEDEDEPRTYARGGGFMVEWEGWDDAKFWRGERQTR